MTLEMVSQSLLEGIHQFALINSLTKLLVEKSVFDECFFLLDLHLPSHTKSWRFLFKRVLSEDFILFLLENVPILLLLVVRACSTGDLQQIYYQLKSLKFIVMFLESTAASFICCQYKHYELTTWEHLHLLQQTLTPLWFGGSVLKIYPLAKNVVRKYSTMPFQLSGLIWLSRGWERVSPPNSQYSWFHYRSWWAYDAKEAPIHAISITVS